MAVRCRCGGYLLATLILSALITGAVSQCRLGYNRTLQLRAGLTVDSITSPGHPDNYPDKARCRWLLYTSPGYVIHVYLAWVDMEYSNQCSYDALTIYDGQTAYHKKIGKICSEAVKDFYSSGSYMYLEFRSDISVNDKGFLIEYSAIRRKDVPTTVQTPPYPWPFPGDTTTRFTTTTSSSGGRYSWPSYSVAALIGGLTGALVLLFVLFALARYYLGRHYHRGGGGRRQTARPYPPTPSSAAAPPPASTIYHNNNAAVFMVSSTANARLHPSAPSSSPPYGGGGATNLAFSPYGEAPPAYFAVQQSTTVVQPGGTVMGVSYGIPPPSYTEAMRFSHPPTPAPLHPPPPPPPPPPPVAGQPGVQPSATATAAAAAPSGSGEVPSVSPIAPATESVSP